MTGQKKINFESFYCFVRCHNRFVKQGKNFKKHFVWCSPQFVR